MTRPRRTYEDNIKIDVTEILYRGVSWTDLAQDMSK
jgi:hypothetical protein